jgi:hypothetical protein
MWSKPMTNTNNQNRDKRNNAPVTRNAASARNREDVITMTLTAPCESAILKDFMGRSQGLMQTMFERVGALKQMVAKDAKLLKMINLWQETNITIAAKQIGEIATRREAIELEMGDELQIPNLTIPDWSFTFEVVHPICREMTKIIGDVNEEIKANERLFFAGIMDEEGVERVKRETLSAMSGVIDRIAKATRPGKRVATDGLKSSYSPSQLAAYIRKGFRLDFADAPQSYISLIEEYEQKTSMYKTIVDRSTPVEVGQVTQVKAETIASTESPHVEASPKTAKKVPVSNVAPTVKKTPKTKKAAIQTKDKKVA